MPWIFFMHLRPDGLPQKLICSVWGLVSTHLSSRVAHKKRSGVWTHVLRHGEDFIFTNTELPFLKRQLWCIYFKIDFIVYNSDTKTGIAEVNRARNVLRCERLYVCYSAWKKHPCGCYLFIGGVGEIWTLAPVSRPIPLAGAPLQPLEYYSSVDQ